MTLEIAEALHCVGGLSREELPAFAADLLAAGSDTPALRRLAGLIGPELGEAAECFSRVLVELGRPAISMQEAFLRLGSDLAHAILAGSLPKRKAAELGAEYAQAHNYEKLFMPLYIALDHYDCPCHGPTIADAEVLRWAQGVRDATPRHAV